LARRAAACLLVLAVVLSPPARGDEMPTPVEDQVKLILKVLTYDRQLEAKAAKTKGTLTLGIVYSPSDPQSVKVGKEVSDVLTGFAGKLVKGLPLSQYLIEYANPQQLDAVLKSRPINVFYVCPGVKGLDYLLKVSEENQITTTTGVPGLVKLGVAVGVGSSGERPQLLINRAAAKAEGVDFEARFLNLSIVTRVGE
jgi:hypothetical protein